MADTATASAMVEVRSLGGELVLQVAFAAGELVEVVKEQIQEARKVPKYQQQLIWLGEILCDHQILGELGAPSERILMQLAVQTIPHDTEIGRAQELMKETFVTIEALDENSLREVAVCTNPPLAVEAVCIGVLHLAAGVSPKVDTKANGAPKDPSWTACQRMLSDPLFPEHLRKVPSHISSGKLSRRIFCASSRRLSSLQPFIDAQMANDFRCEIYAAKTLFNWLNVIGTLYTVITGIADRFGDSLGSTSLFDVINNAPMQLGSS